MRTLGLVVENRFSSARIYDRTNAGPGNPLWRRLADDVIKGTLRHGRGSEQNYIISKTRF